MESTDGVNRAVTGFAGDAIVGYVVREPGATVDRDVVVAAVARRVPAHGARCRRRAR